MKIKIVKEDINGSTNIFNKNNSAFSVEFDPYFESRICYLFSILSSLDFDEIYKIIEDKLESIILGNEHVTDNGMTYSIDIDRKDYKLKISVSSLADIFSLTYNDGYTVKIIAKKSFMNNRLLSYTNMHIIDTNEYGVFIDTICENNQFHQYIKGFESKDTIIANIKALPFRALNIQILGSGRCFIYGSGSFYEIRQELKKLTQKEKEEDTIIRYDGTKEFNLYELCNNLIMLGYENGKALKLSELDKKLEPCRFQGLSNGEVVLSTSDTSIYDIYLDN